MSDEHHPTSNPRSVEEKALANLLDAVQGVLAYDWSDSDRDAVEAIERLRQALDALK